MFASPSIKVLSLVPKARMIPCVRLSTNQVSFIRSLFSGTSVFQRCLFRVHRQARHYTNVNEQPSVYKDCLIRACANGDLDLIKTLYESGANVNLPNYDNRYPIHLASSEGHLDAVKFLIEKNADINVVDRFGTTPLQEAQRNGHMEIVELLKANGANVEVDLRTIRSSRSFSAALLQSIPLLCERGQWPYCEVWMSSDSAELVFYLEHWYEDPSSIVRYSPFYNQVESGYGLRKNELIVEIAQSRVPRWLSKPSDFESLNLDSAIQQVGVISGFVLPIVTVKNDLLCVLLFLSNYAKSRPKDFYFEKFNSLALGMLNSAINEYLEVESSSLFSNFGTRNSLLTEIYDILVAEAVFSPSVIYLEIDWFYHLGLPNQYWDNFSANEIALHLHSYIAAKKLARATGDPENIWFVLESADKTSEFHLTVDTHKMISAMDSRVISRIESLSLTKSYSYISCVSDNPCIPGGSKPLKIGVFNSNESEADFSDPLKDFRRYSFLSFQESDEIRKLYRELLLASKSQLSPAFFTCPSLHDGIIPVLIAFKRGDKISHLSLIRELLQRNNLIEKRSFIEAFDSKVTIYSFYLHPAEQHHINHFLNQLYLTVALPISNLSKLFFDGVISAEEYAYGTSTMFFTYYFANQKNEFDMLSRSLANDPLNLHHLHSLQAKMKREVVSSRRIIECMANNTVLLRQMYRHFSSIHQGTDFDQSLEQMNSMITKAVTSEIDGLIWNAILVFNMHVIKTNFYSPVKACLAYRINPEFLKDYPNFSRVPYGLFLLLGHEFHGFHLRFEDIARGGVRMIKSSSDTVYTANFETLFQENYNLAFTQTLKNKEIPESGSKGTILLNRVNQTNAQLAFKKYVSGILDLIVKTEGVSDKYCEEEIIFLGPDEGTAEYMFWAAQYARSRGYKYWKAFTTGKPHALGGIPHDYFGMTTRSVHAYVVGCLNMMGLDEECVTKVQTGGPDGDLGSNEILISKDKTVAVIDGSGVAYDPNGLDREELVRLAKMRVMIKEFDRDKLGQDGFIILTSDRDITLPNGEVVESGLTFRNEFHLHPLSTADFFVPCGGRPESVNLSNVHRMLHADGRPRFKFIIEGANLFFTNDARRILENAGVILYKDASANKGGVTSSAFEVLAALSMNDEEYEEHMCVKDSQFPPFYTKYVEEIQRIVFNNAQKEFECIWREHERTNHPRFLLTEILSAKINELKKKIKESSTLWQKERIRENVLKHALPKPLIELLGIDLIMQRVPDTYIKAIFASYLASNFLYKFGINTDEFTFFEFMELYMSDGIE